MPCSSARRAIYVDSREQAREEAGDLIEPAARGRVRWEDVHELQDVVAGTVNGRVGEDDVLLFKSSGLAAWDLAVAARVVELARERGVASSSARAGAAAMMSSPIAWITSFRSRMRAICSGVQRFVT